MRANTEMQEMARDALLDAMAAPVFFVGVDYRYLAYNESNRLTVRELYGTEPAVGSSILETITSAQDREVMRANLDSALAGRTHTDGSWYGSETGSRRFYTITYSPAVRDGKVIGVAAVANDATDLLEAQGTAAILSDLVEASDDAFATWSSDGCVASWNSGAEHLTGFTAVEMIGTPMAPLTPPERAAEFPEVMSQVMAGQRVEHFPTQMVRKDGTLVDVDLTVSPVFGENGTVVGGTALARDVSDQHSIALALQLSEQKFEAAFRATPDAVNINRLTDGMYLEVNPGFTELTGYTTADVAGHTSADIAIWNDPADRQRLVTSLKDQGFANKIEAQFRRKDGSLTTAEMSARIIDIGGEPCILSVTRDVSQARKAQAALEESYERLEKMSRDVVQTLGRVVETRDPYTRGHEERAAGLCRLIATEMGMPEEDIAFLEMAALVHDVGKLSIPAEILTKPGTLSSVEHDLIREHPHNSYEILKGIAFDRPIADIVLQHHERMDGTGYPGALAGDQISLPARVLAVADVVEAMATHRPYRAALGLAAAVEELKSNASKYDPDVVAAFLALCDGGCVHL